jgi:diguanylate cyclase (GGDEF)-like protein
VLPEANPPRLSREDALLELLTDMLETLERPARGQFLQRFFRSIGHVDLTEKLALDLWAKTLARKRELSASIGKRVALQAALVDVLTSANLLRLPILMEYEELRKLQVNAATDPLTGLYNRRFFENYFEKELNRCARYSHQLALVILDLHRFKEVNDLHGHQQGDLLLQMAATTLRKSLRTSDYAFRIGGDEFALLLPLSDPDQTTALSRRLRAAYASSIEPLHLGVPLALDYGVAIYPDDGAQQEILIRVADERLYQLKNRTRSPSPAPTSPAMSRPATVEKNKPGASAASPGRVSTVADIKSLGVDRRRWERVSLEKTSAYAFIGEGVERTARVIDVGYGGVAFETPRPEELEGAFHAVLHVPILPPVRVNLRRIYQEQGSSGTSRVGCSYLT